MEIFPRKLKKESSKIGLNEEDARDDKKWGEGGIVILAQKSVAPCTCRKRNDDDNRDLKYEKYIRIFIMASMICLIDRFCETCPMCMVVTLIM